MADRKTAQPTMDDVAARAGVSQMTVSRVMSGKGYISEKVRDRVHAAALEIGYVQNRLARGLRSEETPLVAVVLPTLGNTVFTEVLSGITDALTAQSFRPVFGLTEYSEEREYELVRDLLSWRPSGILLAGLEHSAATRRAIASSRVRVAEIMDIDGAPISTAFGFSQISAGQVTAKHMLAKGHRKFVYVGSQGGSDLRAGKRLEGFRQTLREAGAALMSEVVSQQPSSMIEGRRMTAEILSRSDRPDAIYYSNDDLAAGGIMHCFAQGVSIPDDIAMAGFNGLPYLDALPIKLTTIKSPRYEIGRQAGQFLAMPAKKDGKTTPQLIDLGFELSVGQTC
ncbi:LacI family DNA-binding transcriptional regulator [Roseobacter sp. YSTF-M11]|uniref:LacI family DNA-binding transcriptional regulator n=1 Tax=Roseobacter insulae TaxID=2859783 RepID=A0A9X1JX31_9RHOB|nr:LacI family DNA-binding transcriptional regulator [Roseobacter insulae]MBW4706800.1 LacI family DNA-binding transcriptional regulator [Roseobacter insulae]